MLNKLLEGFGYAAIAASTKKVPAPTGAFFPDRTPSSSISIHFCMTLPVKLGFILFILFGKKMKKMKYNNIFFKIPEFIACL
jgi:hypothetical protein